MLNILKFTVIAAPLALTACGSPEQQERHPMVQREIEQCIAGMGGLVPDDAQRKIVCQCTADATFEHKLDGDAMFKAVNKCRDKAGLDPNDPFDILGNDESRALSNGTPTAYKDETGDYDADGYAIEEQGSSDQ